MFSLGWYGSNGIETVQCLEVSGLKGLAEKLLDCLGLGGETIVFQCRFRGLGFRGLGFRV